MCYGLQCLKVLKDLQTYTHISTHACIHTGMHNHADMYTHAHKQICTYINIGTCMNTQMNTHTHVSKAIRLFTKVKIGNNSFSYSSQDQECRPGLSPAFTFNTTTTNKKPSQVYILIDQLCFIRMKYLIIHDQINLHLAHEVGEMVQLVKGLCESQIA